MSYITPRMEPCPSDPWGGEWVGEWSCSCGVAGEGRMLWPHGAAHHLMAEHGAPDLKGTGAPCPCDWGQSGYRSVKARVAQHEAKHSAWLVEVWDA